VDSFFSFAVVKQTGSAGERQPELIEERVFRAFGMQFIDQGAGFIGLPGGREGKSGSGRDILIACKLERLFSLRFEYGFLIAQCHLSAVRCRRSRKQSSMPVRRHSARPPRRHCCALPGRSPDAKDPEPTSIFRKMRLFRFRDRGPVALVSRIVNNFSVQTRKKYDRSVF
jgi:hypothetical protein